MLQSGSDSPETTTERPLRSPKLTLLPYADILCTYKAVSNVVLDRIIGTQLITTELAAVRFRFGYAGLTSFSAKSLPKASKLHTGGEDALIVTEKYLGRSRCSFLAVLDGVGSWANIGVDSGIFAKALAQQ